MNLNLLRGEKHVNSRVYENVKGINLHLRRKEWNMSQQNSNYYYIYATKNSISFENKSFSVMVALI